MHRMLPRIVPTEPRDQPGHSLLSGRGSLYKTLASILTAALFALLPGSHFIYARGKLVLWSANQGAYDAGESFLKQGEFTHAAIANPETAPYGLAARQVMEHLGVWQTLQPRLVRGDSIAQTFQFVATGNADIGFVADSQLKARQGTTGTTWEIPADFYDPIDQAAVHHAGR